jgi:hypothetical protein
MNRSLCGERRSSLKSMRPIRSQCATPPTERNAQEWIPVLVPALVSEEIFAMAQERLVENKRFSGTKNKGADSLTRAPGLWTMWLWAISDFDQDLQAAGSILSVLGF